MGGGVVEASGAVGAVAWAAGCGGAAGTAVACLGVVLGRGPEPDAGGDRRGEVGVVAVLIETVRTRSRPRGPRKC